MSPWHLRHALCGASCDSLLASVAVIKRHVVTWSVLCSGQTEVSEGNGIEGRGSVCFLQVSCFAYLLLASCCRTALPRGVNNDYLVRTGDSLALLYNDRSPMGAFVCSRVTYQQKGGRSPD